MESNETLKKLQPKLLAEKLKKFKYPALVLALGAVLLLWPGKKQESEAEPAQTAVEPAQQSQQMGQSQLEQMQQQLSRILSRIEGAGQVEVMLTLKSGEKTVYQTDETRNEGDEEQSQNVTTVIVSQSDGGQGGLEVQKICGEYQGALIVSEGADSAAVRLNLVNAVARLTGLAADQITVVKMKS